MKACKLAVVVFVVGTGCSVVSEDVALGAKTVFHFATVDEGRKILGQRDEFVSLLSPFDRQARLQKTSPVSEEDYLAFVSSQVIEWNNAGERNVSRIAGAVARKLEALDLEFPEIIYFIKTTGNEEAGAFYTRQNAVVIPGDTIGEDTLIHELFHVYSRHNPGMRNRLYEIIGFHPCKNAIELPESYKDRKITNPDAPSIATYIEVTYHEEKVHAVPVLYSSTEYQGGSFFNTMLFKLMAIEEVDGEDRALIRNGEPVLFNVSETNDFYTQVGNNTSYIIHPEEILADNFVLTVKGETKSTPRIQDEMRQVFLQTVSRCADSLEMN